MDTVKDRQEITIGKFKCRVINLNKKWWVEKKGIYNFDVFTQFGITYQEIENLLEYTCQGIFPECKSAEDLTKVIEFIMSKDPANKPKKEDYTGRTIKALIKSPQCTGVQIGEEIKILKQENDHYVLDKTAKGSSGMCINKPLDPKKWELVPEKPFKSRFKIGDWIMWDGLHKAGPYKLTAVDGKGFLDQNNHYRDTEDYDYRLAISSDIPKEMLYRDIPEYVECISNNSSVTNLGKMYKEEPIYAYVGDPLPAIKTKPLIEDVQSVSVKLSTKKINNKFKF